MPQVPITRYSGGMTDRFSQLGGHPVLDLMNTVDWRLDPSRSLERLPGFGDVLDWCLATGLLDAREHADLLADAARHPRIAAREHDAVLAWRELAYDAIVDRDAPAMRRVADQYRSVLAHTSLEPAAPGGWAWRDDPVGLTAPRHRIVRATVDLATLPELRLIHQCDDGACGWVYLDSSPRHNRRWCGTGCGNRNRARTYQQRHRSEETA